MPAEPHAERDSALSDAEVLHPVADAFELETGRRPSAATVFRMRKRGLLTTLYLGRRMANRNAVRDYLSLTSGDASENPSQQPRTNRARLAAIQRAEAELARQGII
jgi:hypothetical protein